MFIGDYLCRVPSNDVPLTPCVAQGYNAILIEPIEGDSDRQGQVKAILMGSAVNQDGRSGGLTVRLLLNASSMTTRTC